MDTKNISKTSRVIDLLEELALLEREVATLEIGSYTPGYVRGAIEAKRFEIAEIAAEIVQIVKDQEDVIASLRREVLTAA